MLFSIEKDNLFKIFKTAAQVVVEKKAGVNIASTHVLLRASKESLELVATDLDVEVVVGQSLATIERSGAAVVPLRKIVEICRAITENKHLQVSASPAEHYKLQLKTDHSFLAVNCLEEEVFPVLAQQVFNSEFSINIKLLKELLGRVAFAMGDDDNRQFLNGLSLEFGGGKARAVAADGHRLMVWESTAEQYQYGVLDLAAELKVLIPRKSVADLIRLLADTPDKLFAKVCVGEHHVRVMVEGVTYTSKLLSGGFPPFKSLIPQHTKTELTTEREGFKNCCQRAIALLGDKSPGVKLSFNAESLEISGKNEAEDLIQESMPAELRGPAAELSFNVRYLVEFLSNIDSPQIIFKAGAYNSGSLMQGGDLQSYYVIMPMQI